MILIHLLILDVSKTNEHTQRKLPAMNSLVVYRALLRLPNFKGKARLTELFRQGLYGAKVWRLESGLRLVVQPFDWVQAQILRDGHLEPLTSKLFETILHKGDTYVDVGAHVGFHALIARTLVGDSGLVVAVEPQPQNSAQFLANCEVNGFSNVVLHVAAVGDEERTVALPMQAGSDTSRLTLAGAGVNDHSQYFQVPLRRLDAIVSQHEISRIRLLKIDVEGYELQVLRGLGTHIQRVDNIILEILDPSEDGAQLICEYLENAGFSLRTVADEAWNRKSLLPENNVWAVRA